MILTQNKVKEILKELHAESSVGHLGIKRDADEVRQRYYWLHTKNMGGWCKVCDIYMASRGPRTQSQCLMHQYNVGAPFEKITVNILVPFSESQKGTQYLLFAMNCYSM
jgi:hypothetical protein